MTKPHSQQEMMEASVRHMWAAYGGETGERVPMLSPIPWSPDGDTDGTHFGDWRDEESFRTLARLVQAHCEVSPPHSCQPASGVEPPSASSSDPARIDGIRSPCRPPRSERHSGSHLCWVKCRRRFRLYVGHVSAPANTRWQQATAL